MDRVAEIRQKTGLDDYLVCHTVEEFKNLPVHPVRIRTIAEMLKILSTDDIQEIREITKRISNIKSEVEKATYIKKLHEIAGIPIRSIQKDIQSHMKQNATKENSRDLDGPYKVDEEGYLCLLKPLKEGQISLRLANFTAQITEEIIEDNGIDISHTYVIEGKLNNETLSKIAVPASQFPSLNWLCKWGSRVIIEPGHTIKDNVRHAIQVMSTGTLKYTCYAHTGWREIYGKMAYLTSDGAIGAENVKVKLPNELQRYCLPLIPQNEIEAIKISLSFLELGSHRITLPLWCMVYLSVLTTLLDQRPNFSGYIHGGTGVFKTALSILMLQHFGDSWNSSLLPNFSDTANSLEKRSFLLKDALLVVDDYHPDNRKADAQQKETLAQRLIRSHSNRTGRGRLNADTTDKGRYEPRGMLLITGEELVTLQSTLARLMVFKISDGDIDQNRLTEIQPKTYLLPNAMASFIIWVKDNIQDIQATFKVKFCNAPLITKDMFEKVQNVLTGNFHPYSNRKNFRFNNMIICGVCGCKVLGEEKRKKGKRYIYYHCTFSKGRQNHNGNGYFREEKLVEMFEYPIKSITLNDEITEWIVEGLKEYTKNNVELQENRYYTLKNQYDKISGRLNRLYDSKFDNDITEDIFKIKEKEYKDQLIEIKTLMDSLKIINPDFYELGYKTFELSKILYSQYVRANYEDKAKILKFIASNYTLNDVSLCPKYRKPFDIIAEGLSHTNWLPRQDSNL